VTPLIIVSMKLKEKNLDFAQNKDDKSNSRAKQNEIKQSLKKSNKSNNS